MARTTREEFRLSRGALINTANLTPDKENALLSELIEKTATRKLRWGVQPPSTVQTNIGNLHYVLRLRRDVYRLTARRDGRKTVNFTIERKANNGDSLMQLFELATRGPSA